MITKKHLGLLLIFLGMTTAVATRLLDWLDAGRFSGIGPAQRLVLIGAGLIIIVGLTLLPFGDRPA